MKNSSLFIRLPLVLLVLIFLGVLVFPAPVIVSADSPTGRPGDAAPLADNPSQSTADTYTEGESSALLSSSAFLSSTSSCTVAYQSGGDRLAILQNDDGGWDWPLDDGNPSSSSPVNTVGPIGMGLAQAYYHTYDPDHLAALQNAGSLLLSKVYNFSPSDGYLAAELDRYFGGTTYTDHVIQNFYDPLANGTYNRLGSGTLYDTNAYVNLIRTARQAQGIPNLAAWDIGMGLVGAVMTGASTAEWIAGVKAEIDELDGDGYYDVIGLAGAVYGLAFIGEDYDPIAGEHEAAGSLSDLAIILAGYQINGGGFTWNKSYVSPGNETVQETAYAILALRDVDPDAYGATIQGAAEYLIGVQLTTGGWENYTGGGENNEITGEALWGISVAFSGGPFASNLVANPNPAAVNSLVDLTALLDSTEPSCAIIESAEYNLDGGPWTSMAASDGMFDSPTEAVTVSFTAPSLAGVYDLCVRGTDAAGNVGGPECIMLVVYDPDGGFVTGGGWIDSPSGAVSPMPTLVWDQGFESDTSGWFDSDDAWYGTATRVPSGNNGITSSEGAYHAVFEGDADSAPFSRFDGYRDEWTGSWTAEIDVYLDPAWADGTGFDYSVAASGSDGNHQRDYIFHVTKDTSTGKLLVAGSNNTNFAPREDLENINHHEVTTAGWYTLQHVFYEDSGALAVDLNLLDSLGTVLFTETRFNAADTIPGEVGGNRYAWFTFINVAGGIAADEHQLVVPMSPAGKANFGFVSKYKKGATVPEGNTEFQFNAGDLNFKSASYEWLVITGSNYARFKGEGTINGGFDPYGNPFKFMLWGGDGTGANGEDTFRIKIWYEDGGNEIVVYDNGMDQAIGGGNIVVHTK